MIEQLFLFCFSLFLVAKGATLATTYSARLGERFHVSKYLIGFLVIAGISILPETLIAIQSAIEGVPEFGLGTLFGSNVADLTLLFAILILSAGRGMKIESTILKDARLFPFFLLLPLLFGLNGQYSRIEGAALILSGALFYYLVFKNNKEPASSTRNTEHFLKDALLLLLAMLMLLVGSYVIVHAATNIAGALSISPILIGLLIVSLGTTLPELMYSLKSVKKKEDGLAIGDLLGTVLADATIVVGILACIRPFAFPINIVYVTGGFMMTASLLLLTFMRSGRFLSKKEASILFGFWALYAIAEILVSQLV